MNINPDDPALTAFALGELSGPEREAMAQAVAASPEAQAQVEEIQALAGLLRRDFRLELHDAAEKRLSIVSLLEQGNFWSDWRWVSLTAAAVLAIGAVIAAVAFSPERTRGPLAEKETIVDVQTDATPPELLASSAPRSRPSASANSSAVDPRSGENAFASTAANPVSTFPVQVETASYAKVRRSIRSGARPPKEAVRIEEMINYFSYDYPQPQGDEPFSINVDAATCPWQPANQLMRIGLKGREIPNDKRGASNLVFLLDVSSSMRSDDRLPLLKRAMRLLVDRLTENDRVAIVVYAGASGVALPSTPGNRKEEIVRAMEELKEDALSGGIEGLELAYSVAAANFIAGGVNRVILATDGDLNVGVANERELVQLAKRRGQAGVSLTLLEVGDHAAPNDAMQKVAKKVSGSYAFLDSVDAARKTLIAQINGTLVTIAKDVEVEVGFNPARVSSYRLIGYDNQLRRRETRAARTMTEPRSPMGTR
jgi:Ca-activated chloride channel family protein